MEEHDCRSGAPSLEDVLAHDRPLVLRALVRDWPLVRKARESDTGFAQALAVMATEHPVDVLMIPEDAEGMVGYKADMSGFNYQHFQVPLLAALQRLAHYSREGARKGLAIQSAPVRDCLRDFMASHPLPMLDPKIAPRLWIGNHVITPTHFDSMHNLACVAAGARRFTLFPPDQLPNLYIGPPDFAPTGASISMARLDRPDDPRFPRLREAMAHAQVAELEPGDAIYMPPLWWHNVESLRELNALVNYWWPPVDVPGFVAGHELAAFYHCILAFRALPDPQRKAWRNLLDHYVFSDADPMPHVPREHHGVLGLPPTAEQVERLKAMARRHLGDTGD